MKRSSYKRNMAEWLETMGVGVSVAAVLGYLFYRHIIGVMVLLLFFPVYVRLDSKRRSEKRKEILGDQFQELLIGITGAMQAGYSFERAIGKGLEELIQTYGKGAELIPKIHKMLFRMECNETVEQSFLWLAEETELPEIMDFSQVMLTAKRTGGNLIRVMEHTTGCMRMQREVKREISTLIAGKRLEAMLMNLLIPGILVYLGVFMPNLVAVLYHNLFGITIMTCLLIAYGGSFLWIQKIMQVKI